MTGKNGESEGLLEEINIDEWRSGELQEVQVEMESESFSQQEKVQVLSPIQLTTKKEIISWWMYYFAYEPISAVALVLLVPLLMENLSRQVGHVLGKPNVPCESSDLNGVTCVIFTIGKAWNITPAAFAYYVIGISVALQAFTFISLGALADYGRLRKVMLAVCTWIGCGLTIAMLLVFSPKYFWLAAIFSILINVAFGTASVFYNAYLPLLVQNHPKYVGEAERLQQEQMLQEGKQSDGNSELHAENQLKLNKVGEELGSYISTVGFMFGYGAAIILLIMTFGYLFLVNSTTGYHLQLCIAACGLWWFAFSLYPLYGLKYRRGPSLPAGTNYFLFSWSKLIRSVRKCRRLPTTFAFLACYFFYSDGYSTIGSAAILIAKQSLNVSVYKLVLCALIAPICALIGNFVFLFIQRRGGFSTKTMLVTVLLLMGMITTYCCIGIFTTKIGLRNEWEIYFITSWYGILIGAVQSFSRVLFAELIPTGEESEFFSLYAITDKGSSFLGPIVIAILADYTNQPRFGIIWLSILVLVPVIPLIKFVDVVKGKEECQAFVRERQAERNAIAVEEAAAVTVGAVDASVGDLKQSEYEYVDKGDVDLVDKPVIDDPNTRILSAK